MKQNNDGAAKTSHSNAAPRSINIIDHILTQKNSPLPESSKKNSAIVEASGLEDKKLTAPRPSRKKSGITEVSKSEPCPHCGKPDWCYSIGELSVCNRDAEPAPGWEKTSKHDRDGHIFYAPAQVKKAQREAGREEFIYTDIQGNNLIKVVVVRPGKNGKDKDVYQEYWSGVCWVKAKDFPKDKVAEYQQQIAVYRYQECVEAAKRGEPVLIAEGEGKADSLWKIGIAATSCLGGAGKYKKYGNHHQGLDDALVICPDRDQPGMRHAEEIAAAIPQARWLYAPPSDFFWGHLPASGGVDIGDWIRNGATKDEILQAIGEKQNWHQDDQEQPQQKRNQWNRPDSWLGELGWWIEDHEGNRQFMPKTNFDFEIERELSDDEGGGLVLQFKRSLDLEQKRIIIRSTDYSTLREFVNALKKAYGTGIVCNLRLEQIGAIIHTKLAAYRDRGGKIFKLADRRGQQATGEWCLGETYQLTKEGELTNEERSLIVNNPNLGGEDKIPVPQIFAEFPDALPNLIASMQKFHGEIGILPAIMMLGAQTMGLHYQEIMQQEGRFPLVNAIGDPGSAKTVAAQNALSLVGLHGSGMLHRITVSSIYETLKCVGGLTLWLDDPVRSDELDELLKGLYNGAPRRVRGNFQDPHSSLGVCSNHACGDSQPATLSRLIQIPFFRSEAGNRKAWSEMQLAMNQASGALPQLIKLGYPSQKVRELADEMRYHLPHAHGRVADSLGLITYYSMAVAELGNFDPQRIKNYVITTLCQLANDADSASDSLTDFFDKLNALHAQSQIGEWDIRIVENAQLGKCVAIAMSSVWARIDKNFKPIYSRKVIEALISKEGGIIRATAKFHRSEDESKSYHRMLLSSKNTPNTNGDSATPTFSDHFSLSPPELVTRRCLLVPAALLSEFINSWDSSSSHHQSPSVTSQSPENGDRCNPYSENVSAVIINQVTILEKNDNNNNLPDGDEVEEKKSLYSYPEMVTEDNEMPETDIENELQQSPFFNQVLVTAAENALIAIDSDLLTIEIADDVDNAHNQLLPPSEIKVRGVIENIRELILSNADWGTFQEYFAPIYENLKKEAFKNLSVEELELLKKLEPIGDEQRQAKELLDIIKSGQNVDLRFSQAIATLSQSEKDNLFYYLPQEYRSLLKPD